jgi:hypothetical protein
MESYLRKSQRVPIEDLFPDPNNPRLALEEAPGYANALKLFDEALRKMILEEIGGDAYGVDDLVHTIAGQGWMPIDNILVWQHPDAPGKWVVVEGNRRLISLNRLRSDELARAQKKLNRIQARPSAYAPGELGAAEDQVRRLEQVVADTAVLDVVPVDADTAEELVHKLARVLAVRHITGAKEWGNFAQDIWLLNRYEQLFADARPGEALVWDSDIIGLVAQEASLGKTVTTRQLKAAKWFAHFKSEWADRLPDGEEFVKSDYYLFESIAKRPWVRDRLGIGDDDLVISETGENTLFTWVFKEAGSHARNADDNPNIFYRHENVNLWDQIHRYDERQNPQTSFALRFDPESPEDAPTMGEVEAAYLTHKASKTPHALLDDLVQRLSELRGEQIAAQGPFLRPSLERIRELSETYISWIDLDTTEG